MLGHLKYNQGKSEDVKTALELYQQASSKDAKHELFALFKSDKSCKWAKTYSVVSESKSSSSTGTLSGVCTWYFQQISCFVCVLWLTGVLGGFVCFCC